MRGNLRQLPVRGQRNCANLITDAITRAQQRPRRTRAILARSGSRNACHSKS